MFRIFNKSQFIVGHRGGVSQYSSVLPILFASVDSRFCEFTSKRITMTTSLVNIRFVVEERERERRGEGQRTIKRKRERERTRQIRYTGIAAATRAARGVRPFIGGCPALLSTRASSTSRHPRTSLSLSLSLSFSFALVSMQLGLLPRCCTLSDPEYLHETSYGHV